MEDVTCAERALELWPDSCKYVSATKKLPSTVSCDNLKALCSSAKISFFSSVASVCEPDKEPLVPSMYDDLEHLLRQLERYQTTEPLVPSVYDDLEHLLRQLMKRFVKKTLLKNANSVAKLVKIDVTSKDNRCSYKEASQLWKFLLCTSSIYFRVQAPAPKEFSLKCGHIL